MNSEDGNLLAEQQVSDENSALDARREVLKRIGIYSAVSAPILMGVLKAEKAVAASGVNGPAIPGGGTSTGGTVIP